MSVTTVIDGHEIEVEIQIVGCSEVQNINGTKELHICIAPILPRGPRGPGEPLLKPRAA